MKLPFFHRKQDVGNLTYRTLAIKKGSAGQEGPSTWNPETRSLQVVAATENPVMVFDWERFEVVPEVLLMSGCRLPMGRKIPLLDSHNRNTSQDVLGSARELTISGAELLANPHFSKRTKKAEEVAGLVEDGDVEDFSIGYRVNKHVWLNAGETKVIEGRSFTGPLKVSVDWTPRELSVTPIGADEGAKSRSQTTEQGRGSIMPFWSKNQGNQGQGTPPHGGQQAAEDLIRAERFRISEVTALCERFNCGHMTEQLIQGGTSVDEAQRAVLAHLDTHSQNTPGFRGNVEGSYFGRVEIGQEAVEKRREAVIDGFSLRAGVRIEKPAPGANEYRAMSFVDLARECLLAAGESIRGLPPGRVIEMAIRAHTTNDFPYLLAGTQNKILRASYEGSPDTWSLWTSTHDAVDFKEMSRNQLSEFSDFDQIMEHQEYRYGTFGESKEVYSIYSYGKLFAITRQALINDDLGAFTRVPRAFGAAAKRQVGDLVYGILTTNAAMSDGVTLFHADHSNVGTGAVVDVASLTEARKLMRMQTGLQGQVLNIVPKFIIGPAALETGIDAILNSISLDDVNPGIINPFKGKLTPVIEPRLDATSTTAWYLACSPGVCDTIEIAYLNGQKYPYIESREGWTVDGIEFKARLDVGAKSLDWRGLVYNAGQ